MASIKKMENLMTSIFLVGTLLSVGLVATGGLLFLIHYGQKSVQTGLNLAAMPDAMPAYILRSNFLLTSFNMINLGLLLLVFIQILRVGMLTWFYYSIQDKWFTLIGSFIMLILLCGLIWQT